MSTMTTLSEVLSNLKKEGYTADFNTRDNCLICHGNSLELHPDDFVVDKHYRFEGMSDPADEAVVYAISSAKHNIRGTLVNGYGISAEPMADELVRALKENYENVLHDDSSEQPEKHNEATALRPEGDRPLDAPLVMMDLRQFRQQIKQEQAWLTGDRNAITIFKTNGLTMVLVALHDGAEMKTHKAAGMIVLQVLEGKITFTTGSETASLETGQMLTLHQGILHSVFANAESVFLLTVTNVGRGE